MTKKVIFDQENHDEQNIYAYQKENPMNNFR